MTREKKPIAPTPAEEPAPDRIRWIDWAGVEWWPIERLQPYSKNAKAHPPEQILALAKAIQKFGWDVPIVVDEEGVILKGHGRRLAALELELAEVPVIVRRGLSEEDKRAIRISDNKLAESEWLDKLLAEELKALKAINFDLALTGFSEAEYKKLLTAVGGTVGKDDEAAIGDQLNQADQGQLQSRVKPGEIWQLGRHRLACADSTNEANIRKLFGGRLGKVGMIWADPPFNTKQQQGRTASEWGVIENDDLSDSEFEAFIGRMFAAIGGFHQEPPLYVCCHWKSYPKFFEAKDNLSALIVWVKNNFGLGAGYRPQHEFICFWGKLDSKKESNVWDIAKDAAAAYKHPMQKPTALLEKAIGNSSSGEDLIFDPFLGSGPSIIAAQKLGGDRAVYGFELNPLYCEIILQRWERFTGQQATRAGLLNI